jgi:hypothetical protein
MKKNKRENLISATEEQILICPLIIFKIVAIANVRKA